MESVVRWILLLMLTTVVFGFGACSEEPERIHKDDDDSATPTGQETPTPTPSNNTTGQTPPTTGTDATPTLTPKTTSTGPGPPTVEWGQHGGASVAGNVNYSGAFMEFYRDMLNPGTVFCEWSWNANSVTRSYSAVCPGCSFDFEVALTSGSTNFGDCSSFGYSPATDATRPNRILGFSNAQGFMYYDTVGNNWYAAEPLWTGYGTFSQHQPANQMFDWELTSPYAWTP